MLTVSKYSYQIALSLFYVKKELKNTHCAISYQVASNLFYVEKRAKEIQKKTKKCSVQYHQSIKFWDEFEVLRFGEEVRVWMPQN